ncbi:MAG TPA: hypothetical protein VGD60_05180 [Candidatus Acidoferrales bacterium]
MRSFVAKNAPQDDGGLVVRDKLLRRFALDHLGVAGGGSKAAAEPPHSKVFCGAVRFLLMAEFLVRAAPLRFLFYTGT